MKVCLRVLAVVAFLCGFRASALEAVPSYQFSQPAPVGDVPGGAGFTFSPQVTIAVTALGYGGALWNQEPVAVSILDSNGLQLASTVVTTNSSISGWARYEIISPLTLTAGQIYYVDAFGTNNGRWLGQFLASSGPQNDGSFSVGTDIAYLGGAVGTNSDGSFPRALYSTNYLFLGPNFMYVNRTSLVVNGLQVVSGQVQLVFGVSGIPATSFTLLESDQPDGPWATNMAAVLSTNVPGISYTFTAPPGGPVHFYRVQTP